VEARARMVKRMSRGLHSLDLSVIRMRLKDRRWRFGDGRMQMHVIPTSSTEGDSASAYRGENWGKERQIAGQAWVRSSVIKLGSGESWASSRRW
jgi:hypothetical protein